MKFRLLTFLALLLVSCGDPKPLETTDLSDQSHHFDAFSEENQSKWTSEGFAVAGTEEWDQGTLFLPVGAELVGVRWTGELPKIPYVIKYEARRLDGVDFFGSLTFPVRSTGECVTWIPGGWGGGIAGISSINDRDASENESTQYRSFNDMQWYQFEIEVSQSSLSVKVDGVPHEFTVDGELRNDLPLDNLRLGLRLGPIEACAPLGVAGWQGSCEIRGMSWSNH